MKLYYWNAWGMNFGDHLGPTIVEALIPSQLHRIETLDGNCLDLPGSLHSPKFLALGSILQPAGPCDVVWGTGMAPQHDRFQCGRHFPTIDFRAVRGPLTREYVERHGGVCPEVYGDPGQLLGFLFPKYLRVPKVYEVTVVPHGADESQFKQIDGVFSARQPWELVVLRIAASRCVVTSSLHGIIVAEALGIPAAWLRPSSLPSFHKEGTFKYNDYLLATDRRPDSYVTTVEEGIRNPLPRPQWDREAFMAAFPADVFLNGDSPEISVQRSESQ